MSRGSETSPRYRCPPLAIEFYRTLASFLGFELSAKSAVLDEGGLIKILGLLYILREDGEGFTVVVPRSKRVASARKIEELIGEIRRKQIRMKTLQKVLGNAAYIACSQRSRAGSVVMRAIYPWTVERTFHRLKRDRGARRKLCIVLRMLTVLTENSDPVELTKKRTNAAQVWLYTDASGGNNPRIGALLLDEHGAAFAFTLEVPDWSNEEIDVLEALAMLVAFRVFADKIRDKHVWAAIDNSCALFLLVKCSSKKTKTSKICAETAGVLKELGTSAYYDYVRTELNPGDCASRTELMASLVRMFDPEWRSVQPEMLEANSWDAAFQATKRRPIKSDFDRIFGGKKMKVQTATGSGLVLL